MPKVTWLGDVDNPHEDGYTGDAFCTWGKYTFVRGVPTEVDDPHILHKAKSNRFFHVEPSPYDPFLDAPIDQEPANGSWPDERPPEPVKRSHKKKVVQP